MRTSDEQLPFPKAEFVLRPHGPPLFLDGAGLQAEVLLETGGPRLEIVSGLDWPQLHARYVLTRPERLAEDPRQGWIPCGGMYPARVAVGAGSGRDLPFCQVRPGEARMLLCAYDTYLSLTACGEGPILVTAPAGSLLSPAEALEREALQAA